MEKKILGLDLAIILAFTSFTFATGQTGPGGVGSVGSNPLWLDASTIVVPNGTAISSWNDISGNNNNCVQGMASRMPTFVENGVNGRPSLNFNGTNQHLLGGANSGLNSPNNINYFVVAEIDNFSGNRIPFNLDYGSLSRDLAFLGQIAQLGVMHSYARSPYNLEKAAFSASSGYNIYGSTYTNATNTLTSSLNFVTTGTNTNATYHTSNPHENVWIGGSPSTYYFDGKIAEVFVFNFALNTAQIKIIQNYINAKYGFTVPNDMYFYDTSHAYNVIGIGRDNISNQHTDSQGNGVVRINTPSDLSDGEFLFVGHNNISLSELSLNVPATMVDGARLERTWIAEKTGDLGTVTVIFDLDPVTDFSAANPSEYALFVDSDGDFSVVDQTYSGTYNASENSITFTGVDLTDGHYFTLAGESPSEIFSVQSGDWNDPDTWDCSCVPSMLNEVFIEPTHIVEVDMESSCRALTVNATGGLTMLSGNKLNIFQNLNLYGSFNCGTGELAFIGNSQQILDDLGNGLTFYDITINNSGVDPVVFFASDYFLNGTLSVEDGVLDLSDGGMNFVINSTSAVNDGRVGPVAVGANIIGEVSVRRFIPAGIADYRDLCSPVNNATLAQWDDNLFMSGPGYPDGCAYDVSGCFQSVGYYLDGNIFYPSNMSHSLVVGRGYEVFVGDDLNSYNGGFIDVKGTLNNGTFVKSVNTGWTTYGNPFASAIDFDDIVFTGSVGDYYYIYSSATGNYEYYDGSTGTASIPELNGGIIPMGQGFWIVGPGTASFPQSCKTSSSSNFVKQSILNENEIFITLKQENSTYSSNISIMPSNLAHDGIDSTDILFLNLGRTLAPGFAIEIEGEKVRKNFMTSGRESKSFDLYVDIKVAGYYKFNLEYGLNSENYTSILLYDSENGGYVDLKSNINYIFYSDIFEGHRFTLVLTNEMVESESTTETLTINEKFDSNELIQITQMGHLFDIVSTNDLNQNTEISLVNVLGQTTVFTEWVQIVQGSNIVAVPEDIKGVHVLVIRTGDEVITKKVVL